MNATRRWKLILVVATILLALWFLIPTYQVYFGMTREEFRAKPVSEQDELRDSAIALGLDLQGGMDLLLEVDTSEAPEGNETSEELLDRALSVLRNRIDEFGVTEPVIQKTGVDRITVQLPGLTDPARAHRIIQRVARLEFKLVKEPEEISRTISLVDRLLAAHLSGLSAQADSLLADPSMADSLLADPSLADSLLAGVAADSLGADPRLTTNPFLGRYLPVEGSLNDFGFSVDDIPLMQELLADADIGARLPTADLIWGNEEVRLAGGQLGRQLFVLDKKVQLSGEGIKSASASINLSTNQPEVTLNFSARASTAFSRITGANVGRRLAIILDDVVSTAPVIQGRISGGTASISGGGMTDSEAQDLKVVLEAGALPVPLRVIEERTVGPSLGADSIRQGFRAGLVGASLVILFMLIYYRLSGIIAIIALGLNLLFLFAGLATLGATLTLPGIAGIVLTIGFAVDANVLIFERIREEMAAERTLKASVERGFDRAITAILDANVTTAIAAFVLWEYGSGPIKGFATTLLFGIGANLFTAYFVSRMIFDALTTRSKVAKLSI